MCPMNDYDRSKGRLANCDARYTLRSAMRFAEVPPSRFCINAKTELDHDDYYPGPHRD